MIRHVILIIERDYTESIRTIHNSRIKYNEQVVVHCIFFCFSTCQIKIYTNRLKLYEEVVTSCYRQTTVVVHTTRKCVVGESQIMANKQQDTSAVG